MVKWSIPCDVWLSKSSTPDNPSPRMAFAAGWNAAKASATPHNSASLSCQSCRREHCSRTNTTCMACVRFDGEPDDWYEQA